MNVAAVLTLSEGGAAAITATTSAKLGISAIGLDGLTPEFQHTVRQDRQPQRHVAAHGRKGYAQAASRAGRSRNQVQAQGSTGRADNRREDRNLKTVERATTIGEGSVRVHTVEHVLAALSGDGRG